MAYTSVKKASKTCGIFYILLGLVFPWFFTGTIGLLMDLVGAVFLYLGCDMLTRDHLAFKAGKLGALLVFGARACILASEWIFTANSTLAVIFSLVFMIPDTFGVIMVLMCVPEGMLRIEKEHGVDLRAEDLRKCTKKYMGCMITVLMFTIFSTLTGNPLLTVIMSVALIAALIFLCMVIYKMLRTERLYEAWRASNMGSATWTVVENENDAPGSSGAFLELSEEKKEDFDMDPNVKTIYLAGGCFWGAEKYLSLVPGVVDTNVGYANGNTKNPSYEDVKYRHSGHAETVRVKYDSSLISLKQLLEKYFEVIDPISVNKQGEDEGVQYRTGIYYTDKADLKAINAVYEAVVEANDEPVAVEVLPLVHYFEAEEYHQKYLDKNPQGYCHIDGCMFERAKQL